MPADRDESELPRYLPARALPAYAYRPGVTPHPTRDPDGHSAGAATASPPAPPDPADWRTSADYLYGLDLFNHGYCWEAHEAWEGLWVACGRQGATAAFLQGLINLAAVGFKARLGNARGMAANAATAAKLFRRVQAELGPRQRRCMGLDLEVLAWLAESQRDAPDPAAFDVVLRPE